MLALVLLSCAFQAHAARLHAKVTPVEKVVQMIRDLQTQVQDEGTAEAKTYDQFACFCKSKTNEKSTAIEEGQTRVEDLVADLETYTAERASLDERIQDLNEEIDGYNTQIKTADELRAEETKTFEAALLDMNKAVSALERAIKTLKASGDSTALLQVQDTVKMALVMADTLGLGARANHKVMTALLSQAPDVPVSDYDFHSGDIISTLEGLLNEFRDSRTSLENDNAQAKSDYQLSLQSKNDVLKQAQLNLENAQKDRTKKTEDIATANEDLTSTNAILNDDRVYLKDLTEKCETKAKQWDQRSEMRAGELAALTQALAVLESTVANKAGATGAGGRGKPVTTAVQEDDEDDDEDDDDVSFVQVSKPHGGFLQKKSRGPEEEVRDRIVSLLKTAGLKLKSPVLSTLATKASEDPFVKIKGLIQELIERLLQEEADEADKKGWCDKEIAAATKDRDYRLRDVTDLHTELESLNARKGKLTETKAELEEALATLNADLAKETQNRADEKAENEQTIKDAQEGEAAVDQAIEILSHFYGAAAKGIATLAQRGVDDDAPDAGFGDEKYTGSQSASTGIMGMLDVIKSDFARSISETTAAEEQAQRDFIEFERETKSSIAAKTNALEHTDRELTETEDKLATAEDDIRTQQGMLDAAVETWEKLIPGCVADPGMSYEERVQRRNAEVQALKDAYCILGNEEAGCSGVF
jgi:chromosome segregation ATPase